MFWVLNLKTLRPRLVYMFCHFVSGFHISLELFLERVAVAVWSKSLVYSWLLSLICMYIERQEKDRNGSAIMTKNFFISFRRDNPPLE